MKFIEFLHSTTKITTNNIPSYVERAGGEAGEEEQNELAGQRQQHFGANFQILNYFLLRTTVHYRTSLHQHNNQANHQLPSFIDGVGVGVGCCISD